MPEFLSPYREERYHFMNEYRKSQSQPRGSKQLFNYQHSSLGNVIDQCFRVFEGLFLIPEANASL